MKKPSWGMGRWETDAPQISRFQTAWRKLLNVKGELPPVRPEINLESDRPEYGFLKGEYLWTLRASIAPAAATFCIQVFNPLGSGILAVVQKADVIVLTGGPLAAPSWRIRDTLQVSTSTFFILPRDTRWFNHNFSATAGRSQGLVAGAATAFPNTGLNYAIDGTGALAVGTIPSSPGNDWNLPVVLDEGSGFEFSDTVATTATITVNMSGYLRVREPTELTPGQ